MARTSSFHFGRHANDGLEAKVITPSQGDPFILLRLRTWVGEDQTELYLTPVAAARIAEDLGAAIARLNGEVG